MNNVLIVASANVYEEWMVFASWYSFYTFLPDARIAIALKRPAGKVHQLMNWAFRLKINYCYFKDNPELEALSRNYITFPILKVNSDVCLTDDLNFNNFDENISDNKATFLKDKTKQIKKRQLVLSVKEQKSFPLISIEEGIGRFNTNKWINKCKGCPFGKSSRFYRQDMSINEKRILDLWGQMTSLYTSVF